MPAYDGPVSKAIFRGKGTKATYNAKNGTLTIQYDDHEEVIDNHNVVAVKRHEKDGATRGAIGATIKTISILKPTTAEPTGSHYAFEDIQAAGLPQEFMSANAPSPHLQQLLHSEGLKSVSNLHVLISTHSGTREAQSYFNNVIQSAFASDDLQPGMYEVHTTESDKSVEKFARNVMLPVANEGKPQTVLLLSGDGAIADIVNVMLSAPRTTQYVKPAIGLIAMGTGNALANSTGLNRDMTRGLRHFYRGEPHSLPTFTVSFSPGSESLVDEGRMTEPLDVSSFGYGMVHGAVVCSWALHACLVADSDTAEFRKYGSERFQMAAKELLAPSDGSAPHISKGKITLIKRDGTGREYRQELDQREHMYILTTLVSNMEEAFTISPESKPLDDQLRLVRFGAIPSTEIVRILGLAYQGGAHVEEGAVSYEIIEGMRIDFEESDSRWRRVCVDGKIVLVEEGGWMEVRKNHVDVLDIVADLRQ